MNKKSIECFEELVKNYYGGPPKPSARNVSDTTELFANYYGKPKKHHHRRHHKKHAGGATVHGDDGETLPQSSGSSEYVVGPVAGAQSFQEYVVGRGGMSE